MNFRRLLHNGYYDDGGSGRVGITSREKTTTDRRAMMRIMDESAEVWEASELMCMGIRLTRVRGEIPMSAGVESPSPSQVQFFEFSFKSQLKRTFISISSATNLPAR